MPMALSLALSLFRPTVNINFEGNPLLILNAAGGNPIQPTAHVAHARPGNLSNSNFYCIPLDGDIGARMRVRQTLEEACTHSQAMFRIDEIAQLALKILSLIEDNEPSIFGKALIKLAGDAYALSYIAVISSLYAHGVSGRRKIKKRSVKRIIMLLGIIEKFLSLLMYEARDNGIVVRIKRLLWKPKRNQQIRRLNELILVILGGIERDGDAELHTSLISALNCPWQ